MERHVDQQGNGDPGVLRDMIQNHVFQVLSLVAMEPPANLSANAVRDEKGNAEASPC